MPLEDSAMTQESLFASEAAGPEELLDLDPSAVLHRGALADSEGLFECLLSTLPWTNRQIRMFGREVPEPRLSAWHGDPGTCYTYSGLTLEPAPWTSELVQIRDRCSELSGARFNSVLANYYRNGRDTMGWHSDDEPELGPAPVIASVSLGATRRFDLRHRATGATVQVHLGPGDVLIMSAASQQAWMHRIPRQLRIHGPRINLTFRWISV